MGGNSLIDKLHILHLEDDFRDGEILMETLVAGGIEHEIIRVDNAADYREALETETFDIILADYSLPKFDGLAALRISQEMGTGLPFILVSGYLGEERAIESLKAGATDYVLKGRMERLVPAVKRALAEAKEQAARLKAEGDLKNVLSELQVVKDQLQVENINLRREIKTTRASMEIIGNSPNLDAVMMQAEQVASTNSTVLVLGETGTGKELLARAIHDMSQRRNLPLVVVNCAVMPSTLVESELFGHEKGAFTGATTRMMGRFELADKSTIFLDEVGELPIEAQAKLLRVLQEGTVERIGGNKSITVDVRIIAATNRDLQKGIEDGTFRSDLYYRLNVFPLTLPSLNERADDIPLLVSSFIDEFNRKMGKKVSNVTRESMENLRNYDWPGNIRELRNIVERAMIMAKSDLLDIPMPKINTESANSSSKRLADIEKQHVQSVLNETGWRIRGPNGAAELLGLKPSTLESRITRMGLARPSE
jgi:formate hydrogenlyase transcriptional activator